MPILVGGQVELVVGVPPVVVVVVGATAQVAAILVDEGLMRKAHAGVNIGHHRALAQVAHCPNGRCLHVGDVWLHHFWRTGRGWSGLHRLNHLHHARGANDFDFVKGQQPFERVAGGACDGNDVVNPKALVRDALRIQIGAHVCLGRVCGGLERFHDVPAACLPIQAISGGKVCFGVKIN